jgi:TonB family protein
MSELGMRRRATVAPPPSYPAQSLSTKVTGIAVVAVVIGTTGRVEEANLLEAPDRFTGAEVLRTVSKWQFEPLRLNGVDPLRVRTKFTFYFRQEGKKGVVLSPQPAQPDATAKATGSTRTIGEEEFKKLLAARTTVMLDVRDRSAGLTTRDPRARRLPWDELAARAPIEIPRESNVVLVCSPDMQRLCITASSLLRELGYLQVVVHFR